MPAEDSAEAIATAAPAARSGNLPEELTCPICYELYDDPVCWPAPSCIEKHHFCRPCIQRLCESTTLESLCPLCRAPSNNPILDHLWALPIDDALNARLESEYPEHYATSMARREERQLEYANLPRIVVPLLFDFQRYLSGHSERDLGRGKVVSILLSKPEHFLVLANALTSANTKHVKRFGVLMEGERWGYVAGIVSPELFSQSNTPKTAKQVIAQLRVSRKVGRGGSIKLKILLVDTFRLDGEPVVETADRDMKGFLGARDDVPLSIGTLITSPLGDVKAHETSNRR